MFPTNWATSGNLSSPPSTRFSTGTMSTSSLYELFLPNNPNHKYQTNIGNIFLNIKFSPTVLLVRQIWLFFPQQLAWSTKGSKEKKMLLKMLIWHWLFPVWIPSSHGGQVHRPFNWYTASTSLVRADTAAYLTERIRATISPYNPNTSAKIRMRIMPTNNLGCWAVPRTPASPTIPMAKPAARPLNPTLMPAPKCKKLLKQRRGDVKIRQCAMVWCLADPAVNDCPGASNTSRVLSRDSRPSFNRGSVHCHHKL